MTRIELSGVTSSSSTIRSTRHFWATTVAQASDIIFLANATCKFSV